MNKILLMLLVGMFMISFTAAFEFDNWVNYEKDDLRVRITNAFNLGDDILTAELTSHKSVDHVLEVATGEDIVTMSYEFNSEEILSNGLGEVIFTDMKTGEEIEKDYHFAIQETKEVERIRYSYECEDIWDRSNDSFIEVCGTIPVGTYNETVEVWTRLTSRDIPSGTVTIGLVTDVQVGDRIDGIWTMVGKRISRHSEWTASLNVNLVAYYNFENGMEEVVNGYNGTNTGTTNASGLIGSGRNFVGGSSQFISVADTADLNFGTGAFSVNGWVNTNTSMVNAGFITKNRVDSPFTGYTLRFTTGNVGLPTIAGSGIITGTSNASDGIWNMITWVRTSGGVNKYYVNGVQEGSNITNAADLDFAVAMKFGRVENFGGFYTGLMDEIGIWKGRALSQADLTQLFNGGDGITFTDVFESITVTLNEPLDAAILSNSTVEFNFTITPSILNITNWTLTVWFSNGSLAFQEINTTIDTNETTIVIHNEVLIDSSYVWNVEACGEGVGSICNLSGNRTFSIDTLTPLVNITSPLEGFIVTEPLQNITINFTIDDSGGIIDTCWLNTSLNSTQIFIVCANNFTSTLYPASNPDNLTIFISANDTAGNLGSDNVTIFRSQVAPIIIVESPLGLLNFNIVGNTELLNVTFNDTNLDMCWFDYNGTNITIEGCVSGVKNSTTFILEQGNTDMTIYANDTFGNENSTIIDWTYFVFQNSQTFNAQTVEGSTESFSMNYTANETPSSVNFIYNGTIISADIDTTDFPIVIISDTIVIPNVDSEVNLTFFWNIVSATSNLNTTETNQTVDIIGLDNCSSFTNVLFNYTMVDEETQIIINGASDNVSLEVDISLFSADRSVSIINFSTEFVDTNPNAICSSIDFFNGTIFILDSTVKYSSDPREIEYFNIRDSTIDNSSSTQNITLFDILTSESTEFQITFKNSDFVVEEGALIQVNRQYVSEGVFKTVELPITDSNGQTVVHLVKNDVVYNYIVTKDNIVIGTFENLIAFCEDETIGQCFISLNALLGTEPAFNPDINAGISFLPLTFNATTRNIAFTFVSNDGNVKSVVLNGTKMDALGETNVCSVSVVSSSGTLTCNVPVSLGNETIIITVFVDGELSFTSFFRAASDLVLGVSGYFLLLFLVISLGLMFSESKSMMVGGIMLGFISGSVLFFIDGGIISGGSAIMWLIIMGMILIWKLQSEGQT